VDDRQRNALWQEASERNSRLQLLIDSIAQLVRAFARRAATPAARDSAPAGHAKSDGTSAQAQQILSLSGTRYDLQR